jgi:membrane associated rhomboid family serine protease
MRFRIRYNAPVVLTFSLAATLVTLLGSWVVGRYFLVPGHMAWGDPLAYVRLFTHVLGHAGFQHLIANLTIILLIGPLLEDKHGSADLAVMIAVTALVTGVLNVALFSSGLLGASGVAFMMILLASLINFRRGELPLTFVLVVGLFVGQEVIGMFDPARKHISQFTHLIGGACGAAFGFAGVHVRKP